MAIYIVKGRERAKQAGTGEFQVLNLACAITLPRQRQIIKAGEESEESRINA